jgi:hypothetical protein
LGIKICTEKDDYSMGEPIRCRIAMDSDYKKPGHLRVGLVCVENSTAILNGKKQARQRIIYDWGSTLVENKPLAKNSYYDVVFQTPNDPEQLAAYPPSYVSKGKQGRVELSWAWDIFTSFSKPVRESGEMAWLMDKMPESIREDMGLVEDDKAQLAESSQSGTGFVYSFSLTKDSCYERVSKPIKISYAPTEVLTGESVVAKFTQVGELMAPTRYVKQGEGLDLSLKVWNPTPKSGKVNGIKGMLECWNATTLAGDRIGTGSFMLKEGGKIDPGETLDIPLKTPAINGPPSIWGKDGALIWTCRMETELSWFGRQFAALSFQLLPNIVTKGAKKIKLFKFQPLFTDSAATEVQFCEILARARAERTIPMIRTKILEMIPKLWDSAVK